MLKWLREHKWQIVAALLIAIAALAVWVWMGDLHRPRLAVLRNELAQNEQELQAASREVEELHAQLARKQEELEQLRRANDRRVKEVTTNAYRKARAISDDDLLAAYNLLISGARSRNAERERADTGPKE